MWFSVVPLSYTSWSRKVKYYAQKSLVELFAFFLYNNKVACPRGVMDNT